MSAVSPHNIGRSQGWSEVETEYLFDEVKKARESGAPLLAVFEKVAHDTGRKPNSVRNYYYISIRDDESRAEFKKNDMAFIPFTKEESEALIKTVLAEQAKGISVRSCTLKLGGGDNKAMLRYQNKYRSLIKNDRELVTTVMAQARTEGLEIFNPYADRPLRKSGRPKKSDTGDIVDIVSSTVNELCNVENLDVSSFLYNLGVLAVAANRGTLLSGESEATQNYGKSATALSKELNELKEKYSRLNSLMRRLLALNREFLNMSGMAKVSSLSGYLRDLSRSISDCEKLYV